MLEIGIIVVTLTLLWWASKQPGPATKKQASETITSCPLIPLISNAGNIECASFTEPGTTYKLNLSALTCTCRDSKKRREIFPARSPMALCKHLRATLIEQHPNAIHPSLLELLCDDFMAKVKWVHETSIGSNVILISGCQHGGWLNVYAPKNTTKTKQYMKYGYNPSEDRWSYDKKPIAAADLAPLLQKLSPYA